MDKKEFINTFTDKDKIELAETYLGTMYDQMIRSDYCQKVVQCDLDAQALHNATDNLVRQVLHNDKVNNLKFEHPITLYLTYGKDGDKSMDHQG